MENRDFQSIDRETEELIYRILVRLGQTMENSLENEQIVVMKGQVNQGTAELMDIALTLAEVEDPS